MDKLLKGKLYGIGVGPGDPELLTFKAARILSSVSVVATPDTGGGTMALDTIGEFVKNAQILMCPLPMTRNERDLRESRMKSVSLIKEKLDEGKDAAFITIGDPSVYSTYGYIREILESHGYETETVPGVPSFCAAAAALRISLCSGDEKLHIIPASVCEEDDLKSSGTKIIMKIGRDSAKVADLLRSTGRADFAFAVSRCGLKDEKIYGNPDEALESPDYFSIVAVREGKPGGKKS